MTDPTTTPTPAPTPDTTQPQGWKTKTAGIVGLIFGLINVVYYFLAGHDLNGAADMGKTLSDSMPFIIAGGGLFGAADKLQKLINAINGQ